MHLVQPVRKWKKKETNNYIAFITILNYILLTIRTIGAAKLAMLIDNTKSKNKKKK